MFAAAHPDRTHSIVVYGTMARFRKDADHPWGWADEAGLASLGERMRRGWGTIEGAEAAVPLWAASMVGDERFTHWLAKYARQSLSRDAILPLLWSNATFDLDDVFPAVRVPALVLHRRDDPLIPVSHGRWIAEHIPDARFAELPGIDHLPFVGDAETVLAEMEDFLVGSRAPGSRNRKLLTVVFTDITDSTVRLNEVGDDTWRELLAAHDEVVRDHLVRFGGDEVKQLGDGFLAVFDGPARAIECALGIADAAARLGVAVRVGMHTGECEVLDSDVGGIAVHMAARIIELAAPQEILVSSTVSDLVAGSGIRFGEKRDVELDGIPGPRSVFPVLRHGETPDAVRRLAIDQKNLLRRDGEYWTVAYDGLVATLRDTKGVRDLALLLAAPNRELHVLDIGAEAVGERVAEVREATDAAGIHHERASGDPILDDQARVQYKRRIDELEADIDDADRRGDPQVSAQARQELDALVDQLTAAYGLGGQPRRTPDRIERARKTVTRRIRDTIARTERAHPPLGRHLQASIRTGVFCSYAPERDVHWTVEAHR